MSAPTNTAPNHGIDLLADLFASDAKAQSSRAKRAPTFYGFTMYDLDGYFGNKPPPCEFNVVVDNQTLEVLAEPDY